MTHFQSISQDVKSVKMAEERVSAAEKQQELYMVGADRAMMALPRWQRSGGRDFVFYHSHSGFEWDDLETTNKYQEMLCHDFQVSCHVHLLASSLLD